MTAPTVIQIAMTPFNILNPSPIDAEEGEDQEEERRKEKKGGNPKKNKTQNKY